MRKYRWLALFLLLSLALRWGSFFVSVINHDESTYIVIADELLRGEVYLRDVIDTKPIGIFLIYAALIKLTGGAIWALRAAAAVVIGLGAWGLFLAGRRATGSERVGIAAGVIYCWLCAVFTYYGLSPNTEIFFNCFTIAAVALAVAPRIRAGAGDPGWHWPVAGLLLGCAMIIKPFAAAEALAVGLFLMVYYRKQPLRILGAGASLAVGFALPLLTVYGYYAIRDMTQELYFYTFEVSRAYRVELAWHLRLKYMGDYLLRFSPFVVLGVGALVQCKNFKRKEQTRWGYYLLLQFLFVTTVVLLTGKRFGHYQIQLHPVLALLAGIWWMPGLRVFPWLRGERLRRISPYLIGGLALVLGTVHFFHYQGKDDGSARVARAIATELREGEQFLCLNSHQIAYHLTERPVPTPYVHPSLLFLPSNHQAFRIDSKREAERIISNTAVRYIVVDQGKLKNMQGNPFVDALKSHFTFHRSIDENNEIWRR